jgi:ketosteroid isomerase-like protein
MKTTQLIVAIMTLYADHLSAGTQEQQIVDAMRTMFDAAKAEDLAKFHSVVAPDFYLFEAGSQLKGDAIMSIIKNEHAAGKRYEWNVTEPDVHVSGTTSWIAYIDKSTVTDSSGTMNQNWLESAVLQKRSDSWKIVFMHCTPETSAPHN